MKIKIEGENLGLKYISIIGKGKSIKFLFLPSPRNKPSPHNKTKNYFISFIFTLILLPILYLFFQSCATGVPSLPPNLPTSKLLSISVFFKSNINPVIQYSFNGQDYTYYFYSVLLFRFDDELISNNLDLVEHIFYFENGFKRINRISLPSGNTSITDQFSSIVLDNNSQVIGNRELRYNISLPDYILGNKTFFKFIVIVFLRNFSYSQISSDFGNNVVHYFINPSYSITIDLSNINVNFINSINNTYDGLNNLPPGFPQEFEESLKIEKIEYIYRIF